MDLHQGAKRATAGTKTAPCGVGVGASRAEWCGGGVQLMKGFSSAFTVAPMLISQIRQYNKLKARGASGGRV